MQSFAFAFFAGENLMAFEKAKKQVIFKSCVWLCAVVFSL
jgi:sulfatase maturation enzyme AslB (radical SAM superfamily)